ncbi:hypothetical protein OM416_19725 [Paenibacillus sp. LS1]|uniref:hypothetical protein n=1 Tax=Paenibacillus sp. LS1 TaxID=2992120 RepID=UPI002232158C|nr:hypothetical protein [Paenibacillus sp. LS1]MCW3793825.1 hypothetical protein [Paenibacillus sp. LS1]
MSIKRDVNGYKVFELPNGEQLLWAEEDRVMFVRLSENGTPLTIDPDNEFEDMLVALEYASIERDRLHDENQSLRRSLTSEAVKDAKYNTEIMRLRKEIEEKEGFLKGRQHTINRLKEHNEEIASMGIRQGEQISRLLQLEKKQAKVLEETQKETEFHRNAAKIYRKATSDIHNTLRRVDSENALKRVETIIELALAQEGEEQQDQKILEAHKTT